MLGSSMSAEEEEDVRLEYANMEELTVRTIPRAISDF